MHTRHPHSYELVFTLPSAWESRVKDLASRSNRKVGQKPPLGVPLRFTSESVFEERGQEYYSKRTIQTLDGSIMFRVEDFAKQVEHIVGNRMVSVLYLDSERSYPAITGDASAYLSWISTDFDSDYSRTLNSSKQISALCQDWLKLFVSRSARYEKAFGEALREAVSNNSAPPEYRDPFDTYKATVQSLLPHLRFLQASIQPARMEFESWGVRVPFESLSPGEKEVAFVTAMIQWFQLRQGLLLIDEPELHLHADLTRSWLRFLRDSIDDGQLWVASHSYESVEVAGPDATVLLERSIDSTVPNRITTLSERPIISALANAIGAPGLSLVRHRFVLIEGERVRGEATRFWRACGADADAKFIEVGSCDEVIRVSRHMRHLSEITSEQLRVGAVIDRDFRSVEDVEQLQAQDGVYVLRCHEIENIFLQPENLDAVIRLRLARNEDARELIREASDKHSGNWISQLTAWNLSDGDRRTYSQVIKELNRQMGARDWPQIEGRESEIVAALESAAPDIEKLSHDLRSSINTYRSLRLTDTLWQHCMGKQTLATVGAKLKIGSDDIERMSFQNWEDGTVNIPEELNDLRNYVTTI